MTCSVNGSADLPAICCTRSADESIRQYDTSPQRPTVRIPRLLPAASWTADPLAGQQPKLTCVALELTSRVGWIDLHMVSGRSEVCVKHHETYLSSSFRMIVLEPQNDWLLLWNLMLCPVLGDRFIMLYLEYEKCSWSSLELCLTCAAAEVGNFLQYGLEYISYQFAGLELCSQTVASLLQRWSLSSLQ